jgi:hypothetical protein
MSDGNGKGRDGQPPFGPHGEGCDCGEPHGEELPEEPEEEPRGHRVLTEYDPTNRHELVFAAVSDMLIQQFLITNETLMLEGNSLNRGQLTKLLGGMMRGFASAKEAAWIVEQHYDLLMAEAEAEADEEPADPNPLENLKDTFSHGAE